MSHWKKRRRTKAGRIAVSPFFFLLLALFAAVDRQRLLFPILSAAALHEAGHLAVLRLVGGQIEQFTLTPFGGELIDAWYIDDYIHRQVESAKFL